MNQRKLSAIVFDLDGTLVDSAPDLTNALNHALTAVGRPSVSAKAVRGMIGDGIAVLVRRGLEATGGLPGPDETEVAVASCLSYYEAHSHDNSHLYAGVATTLPELRSRGYRLAVCTNKPEVPARHLLDALGIAEYFDVVVGADTFAFRKPDGRVLDATLARLGEQADCAVMVGDSRNDALAAKGAQLPFVLVSFGYVNASNEELSPAAIVDHFDELPSCLARLGQSFSLKAD
jgi:phosphoglycolate phosphatase